MGRVAGQKVLHFVRRVTPSTTPIDDSAYLAARSDPNMVELRPGHFIRRDTAAKYGLVPDAPALNFQEYALWKRNPA